MFSCDQCFPTRAPSLLVCFRSLTWLTTSFKQALLHAILGIAAIFHAYTFLLSYLPRLGRCPSQREHSKLKLKDLSKLTALFRSILIYSSELVILNRSNEFASFANLRKGEIRTYTSRLKVMFKI